MSGKVESGVSGRLKIAISLTAVTLVAEVAGGVWTNSLALLSDAAHLFMDLFALILSLLAIQLAGRPSSLRHTFGFHRAEVLASLVNGTTVFLMGGWILYEAWQRLGNLAPVKSVPLMVIAVIGLVANLLSAKALHSHSHDDLNVRSAFLHVIGDAAASVGVIAGGVIMHYTGWYQVDLLLSVGIGLLILAGAGRVLKGAVHILMEGVPEQLDLEEVARALLSVRGVRELHHLNVWSICSNITALTVHIELDCQFEQHSSDVLHSVEQMLGEQFQIKHTTIQLECSGCSSGPLVKSLQHSCDHHHP